MNEPIKRLIKGYGEYLKALEPDENTPKIHVDEIAAKFASFYERVRGFIDYKEEHLLRKGFIERVFRRRYFFKGMSGAIGEPLIKEIIRSGRLPNDTVPESKVEEVDSLTNSLTEALAIIKTSNIKNADKVSDWITQITINSIEEALFPPLKEALLSEAMFWSLKDKFTLSGAELSENDTNIQLFIGVQRALLRVDEDQLHYRLFKFMHPTWKDLRGEELGKVIRELPETLERVEAHLKHPLGKYFFKLCNKYNVIFYLLGDIIDERKDEHEFENMFNENSSLEEDISKVYHERYEKERSRLNRLAFLSVLSIFLSKIVVAFGLEIPLDIYVTGEFSVTNTAINVIFPPLLMLLIVMSIKMPSEDNIELVLHHVKNIVHGEEKKGYGIIIPKRAKFLTKFIINTLYLSVFAFTFYELFIVLRALHFSYANIAIFAFFTSLVAATGVKVHNRAKEISMEDKKPRVLGFLIDVFGLPFITVGKWGLAALSKMNILVIIFNLVIELPFQLFVEFVENFRSFIKSKKEELS